MTNSHNNPERIPIRKLLLSLTVGQWWSVLGAVALLLSAAFALGGLYNKAMNASTSATLVAREADIVRLQNERDSLTTQTEALRTTIDDLTRAIARGSACQPIREQLSETIRLYGQTRERLLILETAHEDYDVDPEAVKTNRSQVQTLDADMKRLRAELAECQGEPIPDAGK